MSNTVTYSFDASNNKIATFSGSGSLTQTIVNLAFTTPNTDVTQVIIQGYTDISNNAFYGKTGLTSVSIPASVTKIGSNAFASCTSLTSVSIPVDVTSIGQSAFQGCTSLTSISIPTGVTSIGNDTFQGCTSLTSVSISTGVTSIGQSAFADCTSLTSISIPTGVTSIGNFGFAGCTSLTSISIPASVATIGNFMFRCAGPSGIIYPLQTVYLPATNGLGITFTPGNRYPFADAPNVTFLLPILKTNNHKLFCSIKSIW